MIKLTKQEVVTVLFADGDIEGVEAVVSVPDGWTADEAYEAWLHAEWEQRVEDEGGEAPTKDDLRGFLPYEIHTVSRPTHKVS